MNKEQITGAQIDELLAFLPLFEVPDRTFIKRWEGGKSAGGGFHVPYPIYDDDVQKFYRLAGQPWWSDRGYDPKRSVEMIQDDEFIARATLAEVKEMLTLCVRGERFGDGYWATMLETGRIVALLRRLAVLGEFLNTLE
jgi:hypothetical protein